MTRKSFIRKVNNFDSLVELPQGYWLKGCLINIQNNALGIFKLIYVFFVLPVLISFCLLVTCSTSQYSAKVPIWGHVGGERQIKIPLRKSLYISITKLSTSMHQLTSNVSCPWSKDGANQNIHTKLQIKFATLVHEYSIYFLVLIF